MNAVLTRVNRRNRENRSIIIAIIAEFRLLYSLKMDVELLITEIEKRPVLWDVSDDLYKERNKKNDGWMEVATIIFEHFSEKTQTEQKIISKYQLISYLFILI